MEEVIHRNFSNDRRFWGMCAVVFGAIAILRGLGPANAWITTQAQIDYSQGFAKRALFGQLFTRPLHLYTIGRFTWLSYLFLAIVLGSLCSFTVTSGLSKRIGCGEIVAVFWSSYCLTYFVRNVGYFDVPLLGLTLLLLRIRSDLLRLLVGMPVCMFALLLHEMFLVAFLPTVLFTYLLSWQQAKVPLLKSKTVLWGAFLAMFCVGFTLVVSLQPTLSPAQVEALKASVLAHARFHINEAFFSVLRSSLRDNVEVMYLLFYRDPFWWMAQVASIFFFLPTVVVLWVCFLRLLRSVGLGGNRVLLWGAATAALSPLTLHLIGFDAVRWNSLVGLTSFLILATLCMRTTGPALSISPGFRNACILAIVLGLSSGGSLLDGRLLSYPFLNDPDLLRPIQHLFRPGLADRGAPADRRHSVGKPTCGHDRKGRCDVDDVSKIL